jgi:plastocyanin
MPPHAQMPMGYRYGPPAYGQHQAQPAPGAAGPGTDSTAESGQVSISGMQFSPATLTINAGESVTWQHKDRMPHTVVGDGFASATMSGGSTFTHTFEEPGEYVYQCSLHPAMRGKIVVM